MSSKLTQIAMDFGPESQPPPAPAPAGNGAAEEAARPYLAAGGVGVRVKSFKQPTPPAAPSSPPTSTAVSPSTFPTQASTVPVPPPEVAAELPSRPSVKVINGDLFGAAAATPPEPAVAEHTPAAANAAPIMETPVVALPADLKPGADALPAAEPTPTAIPADLQPVANTLPAVEHTPAVTANAGPSFASPTIVEPIAISAGEQLVPSAVAEPVHTPALAIIPDTEADAPKTRRRTPPGRSTAVKGPSKRGRKSLKEVSAEAQLIEIPADEVLFSKQYYTMGEVSEMFRVNQSLLRFWETEFDILQPKKNKKGDRYFRPIDIKNLHLIYHLLRQKKYTIEGAKEFLKKNKKAEDRFEVIQRLEQIKAFLVEWKAQL